MLNNIRISTYLLKDSYIHKLNPITKVITHTFFVILMIIVKNYLNLFILLILLINILLFSKISYKYYLKAIFSMKFLFIILFILNIMFGVKFSNNVVIIIKIICVSLSFIALILTTPPTEMTYAMEKLFYPLSKIKISSSKIALTLTLSINFIPIVIEKINKLLKIMSSRGYNFKRSNVKTKLIILKTIFYSILRLSLHDYHLIANTMEIRNFDIKKMRTNYRMNSFSFKDITFIFIHAIIVIIIVSEVFQ